MIRAEELIDELEGLRDSLDSHVTHDDIYEALDNLRIRVQQEGVESEGHVRTIVDVMARACTDGECEHEGDCPVEQMSACMGCSNEEPNDEGIVWYTKWETAEWKHHADYFSPHTDACLHGDQNGIGAQVAQSQGRSTVEPEL